MKSPKKALSLQQAEENKVGSTAFKKKAQTDAIKALEKAKSIPRPIIRLKQGECAYSKNLGNINETAGMLNSKDASIYLKMTYNAFARRQAKIKIPYLKRNGNKKYFKISDLDKFKEKISVA